MIQRLLCALMMAVLVPLAIVPAAQAAPDKPEKKATPVKPVLAVFRLSGTVSEVVEDDLFSFGAEGVSLKDLVARIKKAAGDPAVKAIVLLSEGGEMGTAQTEEIRQVLGQLRAAGKQVYAHADSLSMRQYLLLSGASRLSVVPTGDLWITGLYGEAPYLRGLLDKLGVKPDFITCGDYKSAAEIFMREGPSPAAEKMQNWLLDSVYETDVKLIAQGRKVDEAKVRGWIDGGPYTAERAKAAGLIDAVEQRQDFEGTLKAKFGKEVVFERKYGRKKSPKLDLSSPFGLFKLFGDVLKEGDKKHDKSAVGIVYVNGPITVGSGEGSPFESVGARSSAVRKALEEAAREPTINAVVLRVDSPGGSAVASEIILDATKRVKAKKPFVVSMGDVAGSGGYYVACGAETIFADEATITGSIGVVSGKFATSGMWKKAGITFKSYKRGENAGMLSSNDTFTPRERERMQAYMDEIYKVFKDHVVAIRGQRLTKPIDELAGGRVYTGRQALKLGLVDKIGTLEDAIKYAAAQAKLKDYEVRVIPEPKSFFERLLEEAAGGKEESHGGGLTRQASLVNLALPYLRHLDPERVRAVRQALERLQLIQQEGAVLMMPEIIIRN
jgi:protease-4